jgi:hypothetical protein
MYQSLVRSSQNPSDCRATSFQTVQQACGDTTRSSYAIPRIAQALPNSARESDDRANPQPAFRILFRSRVTSTMVVGFY